MLVYRLLGIFQLISEVCIFHFSIVSVETKDHIYLCKLYQPHLLLFLFSVLSTYCAMFENDAAADDGASPDP